MKPPSLFWVATGVLAVGYIAALAFLPRRALAASSGEMATLTKKKPAARKPAPRPAAKKKGAPDRPRLTPPPGLSASEFLARLPDPDPAFDAEAVERIVARRSHR